MLLLKMFSVHCKLHSEWERGREGVLRSPDCCHCRCCRESANCMRRAHRLRVLIILYMVASICLQSHISTYCTGSSIRCAVRPSSPHRTMHASDLIGIARVVRLLLLFLFSSSRCCSAFCQRLIARMMTVTIRLSVYLDTSNQAFVRAAIQMPRCACVCNVNCN